VTLSRTYEVNSCPNRGNDILCLTLREGVKNTRVTRLAVVTVIMAGLLGLMFMSVDPEVQYTVDEVMEDPHSYENEEIFVRGIVENGSIQHLDGLFTLNGIDFSIEVSYSSISVPDGFEEGRTIAVKGTLLNGAGWEDSKYEVWYIEAKEIQTGCPSKYETE